MEKGKEDFCELLKRLDICYKGQCISKEKVLQVEREFLLNAFGNSDAHKTLFIQHTGSECFDVIVFAIVTLALIFFDESEAADVANEIGEGDLVTYHSKRWKFSGSTILDGKKRYILKNDKGSTLYLLETSMCDVSPYNGKSKVLSGIGIGKNQSKRTQFLKKIVGLKGNEISAICNQSVVLFVDNHKFDDFLNNVSFRSNNEHFYILDLVTASFFTDTHEVKKRGNANNNEAMLKATISIDKARELVKSRHGNDIVGFVVFDERGYKKTGMDLEEIIYRKKLPYSVLSTRISMDSWIRAQLENREDILLLPYTSEFIKSLDRATETMQQLKNDPAMNEMYSAMREMNLGEDNYLARSLQEEIGNAVSGECKVHYVDSSFKAKDFKRIKDSIASVMTNCLEDPKTLDFCRWSYSMLKLFNNAIFTFEEYEKLAPSYQEMQAIIPPSKQIDEFQKIVDSFPTAVRRQSQLILDYISQKYSGGMSQNSKRDEFRALLRDAEGTDMLIIVPSMRYKPYVERFYPKTWSALINNKYSIVTEAQASRLDISRYSDIIYLSLMNFSKYNPFNYVFSSCVDLLIYDSQKILYKGLYREFVEYKKILSKRAFSTDFQIIDFKDNSDKYDFESEESAMEYKEEINTDDNIHKLFMSQFLLGEKYLSQRDYSESYGRREHFLEAYKYASLISGENIIFTKGYTAYVIDTEKQSVVEKSVDEIREGDQLIFTVNDDKTKDIVDELLLALSEKNHEIAQSYKLVSDWKEACRTYKFENNLKYTQLAKIFVKEGFSTHPQVLRGWLDEESHIVGPKQEEAFLYIQKVFGKECLPEDYMQYALSTKIIRSARVKILKLIEKAVISENVEFVDDTHLFEELKDRIKEIAIVKQIDHIEEIEPFTIAGHRANKPIDN